MFISQQFSEMGLLRKAILEMLRGNSFPAISRGKKAQPIIMRVATYVIINYSKALRSIRDQSNNTSLAILSIINYILIANLYLIPKTVRSSL